VTTPAQFPHNHTLVVAAFGGWSDAAQTATDAVEHLLEVWDCEEVAEIQSDEYYNFQDNRPEAVLGGAGEREIIWPTTTIYQAKCDALPTTNIYLVHGVEPSLRWKQFISEIHGHIPQADNAVLIGLGAMMADVPHTRPIPMNGTTSDPILQEFTGFDSSRYEGPTGILGVMQAEFDARNISAISLWAAVPHYVASPPCPKGVLALVRGLEDILDIAIPVNQLIEDSRAWEAGVAELMIDDEDVAEYVRSLEEQQDTAELPEASGEAIAREFERYLRRREN